LAAFGALGRSVNATILNVAFTACLLVYALFIHEFTIAMADARLIVDRRATGLGRLRA
jgi:hypothetical protein